MNRQPIKIGNRLVGPGYPAYIIAEIGSNFDGDLERAKMLAKMSKDAGADAYKIQNFLAPKIVSAEGFKDLQVAFQAKWDKPVVEVYKNAEFPREWVKEVADYCKEIDIEFFSSPYDEDAVDLLEELGVAAYKVGSGEIDNLEFITRIAKTGKPVIIGAGAATIEEVEDAIRTVRQAGNEQIVLLQCVTNYPSPMKDANLRAMVAMGEQFNVLYGYSDHTIGTAGGGDDPLNGITVPLASVALGGCLIEKHVTDDTTRKGPDHPFAMVINGNFKDMIAGVHALESALGDGHKGLTSSETETSVIQRRGAYALRDITSGETITRADFEYLRPAVGIRPREAGTLIGGIASRDITKGKPIKNDDLA
ncbi:MAG: N-acetylneuraminate synthase family protein [Patescibacteria group bacterium]